MPGHVQYTLGHVPCIDNVVDNARSRGISPDGVVFLKLTMETQSGKQKSEIELRVDSRHVRESTCLETQIQRNGHTLCRQNATITHFVKFVTTVFSLRMAVGMMSLTHH